MMRERLPNRRAAETFGFEHGGRKWTATISRFPDGRVAEIFIDGSKGGPDRPAGAGERDRREHRASKRVCS